MNIEVKPDTESVLLNILRYDVTTTHYPPNVFERRFICDGNH